MFHRTAVNATLVLVSLGAALALVEVGLRLSGRVPTRLLRSVSAADYDRIPGFWEPHQAFVNRGKPDVTLSLSINALGLRGPETTRAPRGLRVLCLGDSFTFGEFVDDAQTLPAQLSARLPALHRRPECGRAGHDDHRPTCLPAPPPGPRAHAHPPALLR